MFLDEQGKRDKQCEYAELLDGMKKYGLI